MTKSVYYQRPDDHSFQGRQVEGLLENVEYSLNSNIRIWHNIQMEGYAPHQHSALEILIPVENEYTVIINKKSYTLHPGDILFIPRFSIHEILPVTGGSRFIYMFNMEPLSSFYDSAFLDVVLLEPCLMNKQNHGRIYERIYSGFMEINDIYFPSGIFWEYSIYAILINILTTIGGEYYHALSANSQTSQEKHYEYYQKFTGLLSYIDAHYGENLTLEKMASYIGFSKYHFSRLFKEHTNSTFYDYLSRKRIQAAQEMLLAGESITSIAFQTGFNNPASFSRCFKKYTKYNPTEFRSQFSLSSIP
jgi:AraC-like DNA-binding protein/mannose-6-phosphate isomerase-like protein (cupin superfamily)